MNTLVLGGTQFVGLRLVQHLHSLGHRVTVLNRGRTGAELPDGVARLKADRSEPAQIAAALRGQRYDAVFDISGYTPAAIQAVLAALGDGVGHYVFCSSVAVYAPTDLAPITEDSPLDRGPDAGDYAGGKIACEDLLLEAQATSGLPVTILRPPYVYGPYDHIKEREFAFFARLTQSRKVIVPGDGHTLFHSVHVDDLAAAFAAVPGNTTAVGQAYTICGSDAITFNGYLRTVGDILGVEVEIVYAGPSESEALFPDVFPFGWDTVYVHTNEKARRDLDWQPRYDMRSGLEMTYRWWLERGLDKERWDFSADDSALERLSAPT